MLSLRVWCSGSQTIFIFSSPPLLTILSVSTKLNIAYLSLVFGCFSLLEPLFSTILNNFKSSWKSFEAHWWAPAPLVEKHWSDEYVGISICYIK